MSDRVFRVLYSYFFIPGLLTGISFKTGVDVSETDIASLILDAVCKALQSPACVLSPVFKLVGILMTVIPFAVLLFIEDYGGLFLGFLFFISGILFTLNSEVAVIIFLMSMFLIIIFREVNI